MKFSWILVCFLCAEASDRCSLPLLNEAVEALGKSLNFMKRELHNINLDGVIGCRMADDQLSYLLDTLTLPVKESTLLDPLSKQLRHLQGLAEEISNKAIGYIRKDQPQYYESLGPILNDGQWNLRYPSRQVSSSLRVQPIKCADIPLREHISDQCIAELLGTNHGGDQRCNISEGCWQVMTARGFKGYALTHQVLYLEIAEMNGCLPQKDDKPESEVNHLQDYFCANVHRDAELIAEQDFPDGDRDLFMEQVALCGMLGYEDMFQNTWLQEIISWQQPNGCYTRKVDRHWSCSDRVIATDKILHKREEKKLKGNCLSHRTSVAIAALTTNIRFCLENVDHSVQAHETISN